MRTGRTGEAGFLLAETLATLALSAVVLAGLVALGALFVRSVDRSVAALDRADDLGRTLLGLDGLIRSAVRARLDGAEGQPFVFNGDEARLMLAARDDAPGAAGLTRVVALRSEDGRLWRAEAALPARVVGLDELRFGPPRLVYAGAARLRFAYAGPGARFGAGGALQARWPVGGSMPSAVRVEAREAATGRILAAVRAGLVADSDPGCLVGGACGGDRLAAKSGDRFAAKSGDRPAAKSAAPGAGAPGGAAPAAQAALTPAGAP